MDKELLEILIVEDNQDDLRLILRLAEKEYANMQVTSASTLSQAMDKISQKKFDAIVLDLGLPDSWGYETFEKIFSIIPQTPIVVNSALNEEGMAFIALKKGAKKYFTKGPNSNKDILDYILNYDPSQDPAPIPQDLKPPPEKTQIYNPRLSHDLRGCFNNILAFQQIIETEAHISDPEMLDMVKRIKIRCEDGLNLISLHFKK